MFLKFPLVLYLLPCPSLLQVVLRAEPRRGKPAGPAAPVQPGERSQRDGQPGLREQEHAEDADEEGAEDHEERGGGEAGHALPPPEVTAG